MTKKRQRSNRLSKRGERRGSAGIHGRRGIKTLLNNSDVLVPGKGDRIGVGWGAARACALRNESHGDHHHEWHKSLEEGGVLPPPLFLQLA